ncbi:MAG: hypothetical protein EKK41_10620 [Hyphomicrobiales bacterium]|nr:MAG: hypothetical protein EKK41_10620 [Hyphomicrobiales bacterium]
MLTANHLAAGLTNESTRSQIPAEDRLPAENSKPDEHDDLRTRELHPGRTLRRRLARPPTAKSVRRGVGRPSKYDPAYCKVVIRLGKEGKSRVEMASALHVNRDTLTEWTKVHPDFHEAMLLALQFAQAYWEEMGRTNLFTGRAFNQRAWIFMMKRRFPQDYK